MKKPRICASIVNTDITLIKKNEHDVDIFEVRIDLIGPGWPDLVKLLKKPWIACNRSEDEGGNGNADPIKRTEELLWAAEVGACIVDLEYRTRNLVEIVPQIKARAKCLLSFHDLIGTPSYEILVGIVEGQIKAGADYCKVVTTAQTFEDNLTMLKLIKAFPGVKLAAFAMGEEGRTSRILSPLVGGYLTYASLASGNESAPGQITVKELRRTYELLR
jgi:3-dehydroquinate dehydratase type I